MGRNEENTVILKKREQIAPTLILLQMESIKPFDYSAGDYITLLLNTVEGVVIERPFSIASSPRINTPTAFELLVSVGFGGQMSDAVEQAPIGTVFNYRGPEKYIRIESEKRNVYLFSENSGVAPFRSYFPKIFRETSKQIFFYYLGSKEECSFIAREVTQQPHTTNVHLSFHEQSDRNYDYFLSKLSPPPNPHTTSIYVCGSKTLRTAITEFMLAHGVPRDSVYT